MAAVLSGGSNTYSIDLHPTHLCYMKGGIRYQSLLLLTVVQGDEKYTLDHVIDIELFTQLLPGSEGAADLCHRVVIVINTV